MFIICWTSAWLGFLWVVIVWLFEGVQDMVEGTGTANQGCRDTFIFIEQTNFRQSLQSLARNSASNFLYPSCFCLIASAFFSSDLANCAACASSGPSANRMVRIEA